MIDPLIAHRVKDRFEEVLAENGLRMTGQRRAIIVHMLGRRHETLDEIYAALKSAGIGRATVYRTLKLMEDSCMLRRMAGPDGTPRYEFALAAPHHDHLVCVECGLIAEVRWPELEKIQHASCRKLGFQPIWHRHEVFGRCKSCAGKRG